MQSIRLVTTVTERGQTAIPARIRRHWKIRSGQKMEWIETEGMISLIPASNDPIQSFRGSSKGWKMNDALLMDRRSDARKI
jgi:AbrB family looped-hinge helix DNA binding protein